MFAALRKEMDQLKSDTLPPRKAAAVPKRKGPPLHYGIRSRVARNKATRFVKFEALETDGVPRRKQNRNKSVYPRTDHTSLLGLAPEEVTQRMLDNVCYRGGGKKYDPLTGTSCHQCRQKTTDMKTICRSGRCSGVRGTSESS